MLLPVLGLMSGTSLDGIDASFVHTDGISLQRTNHNSITPYSKSTLNLLKQIIKNTKKELRDKKLVDYTSNQVTIEHASASQKLIDQLKNKPKLIGFHGQTVFHNPSKQLSIQLGDGFLLSKLLKTNVVHEFRKKDLLLGGQGAPIAPIYHKSIIESLKLELPATIINIGGITNITYYDGEKLIGFDVGPGNNLMDYFMQNILNKKFDYNGTLASKGTANLELIEKYCTDDFFKQKPPKSLERNDLVNNYYFNKILLLKPDDCMATLSLLSTVSIKIGYDFLPKKPKTTIVVGGGQNNKFLMKTIKQNIENKVFLSNEIDLTGDYVESELISFLAARKFYNLPSTFPLTTGVCQDTICGRLITFN